MDLIRTVLHGIPDPRGLLPLLLESAVAALSYLFGAFVLARSRASTPWWPMAALVPFAALLTQAATATCMLYLFLATAGGFAFQGFAAVVFVVVAFLGSKFGSWAVAPRTVAFRLICAVAAFVVAAYLWQLQARLSALAPATGQVSDSTRKAADSSAARAVAAAHAASALSPIDTTTALQKAMMLARPGDDLQQFLSQLSPSAAADPTIKYEIRRADLGVRLFLTAQAKVKLVRFDWPYAGSIGGVRMGDSLDDVRRALGTAGTLVEDGHPEFHHASYNFERLAGFSARVDFDDAHRVTTIVLR